MRTVTEHGYATYPRRFAPYMWYKPLLTGLLFALFAAVFNLGFLGLITKVLFWAVEQSAGYDGMDFYSAGGAFYNGVSAASVIPCLFLAALIVRDRPVSSYLSSMGGWRWKVFLKTLGVSSVILGIPTIVLHLLQGRTGQVQFTLGGFILLTLLVPFQGIGEELVYRGYIMQTVASWLILPAAGIIVQTLAFASTHPYNVIGITEIAVSGLLYALVCVITKGIEAGSALHIVNNMFEICMCGIGFGSITAEQTIPSVAFNLFFKLLFFAAILYADRKLHWFDQVQADDVSAFNNKGKKRA